MSVLLLSCRIAMSPQKITDQMQVWPAQPSREIKAAHMFLAPLVQVIVKEKNTCKPGKKVASPD